MTHLLVTGGCGFIGANFVRFLLHDVPDVDVVNLDALTYAGNLQNLDDVLEHPRHRFVRGDIRDSELVGRLLCEHGIEGVLNFAAESHVDRSIRGPEIFVDTNVRGTLVLLEQAMAAGVSRFLQVSTDEVYGSLGAVGRFTEDSPIQPNSPYSASKAGADHLVRAYRRTYGLDTVVTRCSNNYGPYQFPEKMIPLMYNNARQERQLPVYGDGLQVRDWLHVLDHCRGIWAAFTRGESGRIYNFGGHAERTNLELVRAILAYLDRPESLIKFVTDRPGHDRRYAMDASRAREELGWQPLISFEDGLRETLSWYEEHPQWLRGVTTGEYQDYYRQMYEA